MGSFTATSVIWVGHESPSLEFGAERPARRHDHCRAPNRLAPCSTGMPLPSVEPATPPTDCGSPQTTAVASVHGPEQERQTAARRSGLELRTDRLPQWRPHGCAGMSASSAKAVHGAGSCTSKPLTSTKRFVELRGFRPDIGLDGWPLDPNHPVYSRGR